MKLLRVARKSLRGVRRSSRVLGIPSKVLGFVQDITARKNNDELLKASNDKFHYLFNNSPDGIYIEDFKGNILEVNE